MALYVLNSRFVMGLRIHGSCFNDWHKHCMLGVSKGVGTLF